ncbi:hypothetical protein BDA96_06G209900 [Sorghum bicolor]|uniref:Uncharacterized protein n=2 Tax=Sorghum bicolor TaxID=4558 RepID=A0A921UE31_SORBI|nr:hypothetical protein BDA96_06G209900 [Sorghum bicolor]OQU82209.1 hypothetical protein SORBI_3006G192332 [Sorghum bicolor]
MHNFTFSQWSTHLTHESMNPHPLDHIPGYAAGKHSQPRSMRSAGRRIRAIFESWTRRTPTLDAAAAAPLRGLPSPTPAAHL